MAHALARYCCGLVALALATGAASAGDPYPSKPIRLLVGFGVGGPTDLPARLIADKLGALLGRRFIVVNKTGAAGMLATQDVLSQAKDGYNLLLCTHFESINVALYKNVPFKLSEIAPISLIAKYYYGLALSNSIPAEDFDQFLSYAKSYPGEVTYATVGAGSAQEIFARQLEKLAGITMNKIPFRGGSEVFQELVAGRIHFYVSPMLAIMPQYQAKQLKIIAVTSPERLKSAPEIPTLTEKGFNFVRFGWLGICAAAGTPQPIIDLLNRSIISIVDTPDYRSLIENVGGIAIASTPSELNRVMIQTHDEVAATIREFGLQVE